MSTIYYLNQSGTRGTAPLIDRKFMLVLPDGTRELRHWDYFRQDTVWTVYVFRYCGRRLTFCENVERQGGMMYVSLMECQGICRCGRPAEHNQCERCQYDSWGTDYTFESALQINQCCDHRATRPAGVAYAEGR